MTTGEDSLRLRKIVCLPSPSPRALNPAGHATAGGPPSNPRAATLRDNDDEHAEDARGFATLESQPTSRPQRRPLNAGGAGCTCIAAPAEAGSFSCDGAHCAFTPGASLLRRRTPRTLRGAFHSAAETICQRLRVLPVVRKPRVLVFGYPSLREFLDPNRAPCVAEDLFHHELADSLFEGVRHACEVAAGSRARLNPLHEFRVHGDADFRLGPSTWDPVARHSALSLMESFKTSSAFVRLSQPPADRSSTQYGALTRAEAPPIGTPPIGAPRLAVVRNRQRKPRLARHSRRACHRAINHRTSSRRMLRVVLRTRVHAQGAASASSAAPPRSRTLPLSAEVTFAAPL